MFRFTISITSLLAICCPAANGAIYFAAEQPPPPSSAPAEAPLCYKFQDTVSLEEQLGKLKAKYGTALYDEKIVKDENGSRYLLAKKKDEESGLTMEYFYSDNPTVCNEYKKENSLDKCFAMKAVFGNCDEESKSVKWIRSDVDDGPIDPSIFCSKDFFQQGIRRKFVVFTSRLSCGVASCTDIVSAAIFSKQNKTWKLDIFNKELGEFEHFPGGEFPSAPLKFKRLGKDGIAVIVEDIYPSIDRSIDDGEQVYA